MDFENSQTKTNLARAFAGECQAGARYQFIAQKAMQEGKMVVWGGFTNSWGKKRSKRQRRKGKIYPTECRVPENSKER